MTTPPTPVPTLDGISLDDTAKIQQAAATLWKPILTQLSTAPEAEESPEIVYALLMISANNLMRAAIGLREGMLGETLQAAFNRVNANFAGDMIEFAESKSEIFFPERRVH